MIVAMDGQGGGKRPDFVWDAESSSGDDRHMFRAVEVNGDVVLHYVAVEDGRGTMVTFSLAGGRFLTSTLPSALAALSDWTERRETERFGGPVDTWAEIPSGHAHGKPVMDGRSSSGTAGGRSLSGAGRPARQGASWTKDEEDRVRRLHGEGKGVSHIAVALERSPFAVEKRLEAFGLSSVGTPVSAA